MNKTDSRQNISAGVSGGNGLVRWLDERPFGAGTTITRNCFNLMSATTVASSPLPERELVLTRIIDAPREHVFAAWTTQLPQWWGPHGFTTPEWQLELRPGGVFRT